MPRRPKSSASTVNLERVTGAKRAGFPGFIEPSLAQLVDTPPTTDDWVHEIKIDGYRLQAHINRAVALYTRSGLNWTAKFRLIVEALEELLEHQLILDGEAAVLRGGGISDFHALQNEVDYPRSPLIVYVVFDILYLDGFDLRAAPFMERRRVLENLFLVIQSDRVQLNPYIEEDGRAVFEAACANQLEGTISKKKGAGYLSGRNWCWQKCKCYETDTFPVVGFTEKLGANPRRIASLYIGRWEGNRLLYGGKVGTGFSDKLLHTLREVLDPLIRPTSPLSVAVRKPKATWVEPVLQIDVRYGSVTSAGVLRAASYKGIRADLAVRPPATAPRRVRRRRTGRW
jgi:bifunctional non-homologous end joining protein LigD